MESALNVKVLGDTESELDDNFMMLHGVITVEDAVKGFLGPLQDTAAQIAAALTDKFRATLWATGGAKAE